MCSATQSVKCIAFCYYLFLFFFFYYYFTIFVIVVFWVEKDAENRIRENVTINNVNLPIDFKTECCVTLFPSKKKKIKKNLLRKKQVASLPCTHLSSGSPGGGHAALVTKLQL